MTAAVAPVPGRSGISASKLAKVRLTFDGLNTSDNLPESLGIGWVISDTPPANGLALDGGRFGDGWADSWRIDQISPTISGSVETSIGPGGHNNINPTEGQNLYFAIFDYGAGSPFPILATFGPVAVGA